MSCLREAEFKLRNRVWGQDRPRPSGFDTYFMTFLKSFGHLSWDVIRQVGQRYDTCHILAELCQRPSSDGKKKLALKFLYLCFSVCLMMFNCVFFSYIQSIAYKKKKTVSKNDNDYGGDSE